MVGKDDKPFIMVSVSCQVPMLDACGKEWWWFYMFSVTLLVYIQMGLGVTVGRLRDNPVQKRPVPSLTTVCEFKCYFLAGKSYFYT